MKIEKKDFNPEQYEAIVASSNENILISAGAGSGKTKTLSTRVNRLIVDKEVDPSALLVLTFTDNAAHEMEERIVNSFTKSDDPEVRALGVKMLSSHIQTFDSFSQYLVSTYASRLGIGSSISILDESIEKSKISIFLDEIFKSHYENPAEHDSFVEMLTKYNSYGDSNTKKVVLDVYRNLQKLMPRAKQDFYEHYDEHYFNKEKFVSMRHELVEIWKKKIIGVLLHFSYKWNYEPNLPEIEDVNEFFAKPTFFQSPVHVVTGYDFLDVPYQEVYSMLSLDDDSFVAKAQQYHEEKFAKKFPFPKKKEMDGIEDERDLKGLHTLLAHIFDTQKATLIDACKLLKTADDDYRAYLETQNDVHIILRMVQELEEKLSSYKKETNCFTFADVSSMSLRLLTEPEFEDVAEAVRSRFSYIMVDEYQDTNDFQEAFLDSLLKPNKEGKKAHLFCVGDPKQAIYAFRNSNVKLFINRQERLEKDPESKVIHMNKNYRSGHHFLEEVNYLFKYCMRKDQGDVDYLDPGEQLAYDGSTYKKEYPYFGISRIISARGRSRFVEPMDFEVHAIVDDIKNKIANNFPVYERNSDTIRPCKYSDFAILCRTKNSFLAFQKAFQENGMPLNVKVDTNLLDVNAVLAFESLVGMLDAINRNDNSDLPHLFASLARSYLFSYDDAKVFSILEGLKDKEDPYKLIKEDDIYLLVLKFKKAHEDSCFRDIFLDLIDSFGVIKNLPSVGNISDNVEKLDSLFSLALTQEKMGEGIQEFVDLFSSIKRYALPFDSETSLSAENSVDLMTIHASKGLERQIVYMPVSQCKFTRGFQGDKPDYDFDKDLGILLPRYILSPWLEKDGDKPLQQCVYSLPYLLHNARTEKSDPDFDEHIRLIYVALTRAQNSLCIVGENIVEKSNKKGSLYYLLDQMPHRKVFEPSLLTKYQGMFEEFYPAYENAVKLQNNASFLSEKEFGEGISKELLDERYPIYKEMRKEFLLGKIEETIDECLKGMTGSLFEHYLELAEYTPNHYNFFSMLYGQVHPQLGFIPDYRSFVEIQKEVYGVDENTAKNRLNTFIDESTGELAAMNKDVLLPAYAYLFDNAPYVLRDSYENGDLFKDPVEVYQYKPFASFDQESITLNKPEASQIDDTPIVFAPLQKKRASKKREILDPDDPVKEILDYGTRLHRYMELVDFQSKDTSFISNEKERALIDKVLGVSIFKDVENFKLYQEYGYFDSQFMTTGSIDLLMVSDDEIRIIDYKTKRIDDPAYVDQLRTYRRNVCSLFKVSPSKVKAFLLPLTGEEATQVDLD